MRKGPGPFTPSSGLFGRSCVIGYEVQAFAAPVAA